jgi:hypothetical protein
VLLLLLGPEHQQLLCPEANRTQLLADARIHPPELLQHQSLLEISQTGPPVLLRDEEADEIQLAGLFQYLFRKDLFQIELAGDVGEFAPGKFPGSLLNVRLLFGQLKIHPGDLLMSFAEPPADAIQCGFAAIMR